MNTKHIIKLLKKEARTIKERKCYPLEDDMCQCSSPIPKNKHKAIFFICEKCNKYIGD